MAEKIDGPTLDLESTNRDKLHTVFPELTEERLDIDKRFSLCGEYITDDFEKENKELYCYLIYNTVYYG